MGKINSGYNILVGEPEEQRPFGKHRSRHKGNIN
jgi:hypothetical protein